MPRGGLRKDSKGTTNHLFNPKWKLGKTSAIRIPTILKDKLLNLARYLDSKSNKQVESIDIIEQLENNIKLNSRVFKLHNETVKLNYDLNMLTHINDDLRKQLEKLSEQNRYQIATECFEEYLKSQDLEIEELSKSRKGSKKHLLFEVKQWLKSQHINDV